MTTGCWLRKETQKIPVSCHLVEPRALMVDWFRLLMVDAFHRFMAPTISSRCQRQSEYLTKIWSVETPTAHDAWTAAILHAQIDSQLKLDCYVELWSRSAIRCAFNVVALLIELNVAMEPGLHIIFITMIDKWLCVWLSINNPWDWRPNWLNVDDGGPLKPLPARWKHISAVVFHHQPDLFAFGLQNNKWPFC